MLGRLERDLARERLPDEQQRGDTPERGENPQRPHLDVDRAVELCLDGPLRLDLERAVAGDALDAGTERVQIRVPAPQPYARHVKPFPHATAVRFMEGRRQRGKAQAVIGLHVGANPDDAQGDDRSCSRGLGVGALVELASLGDPHQLLLCRETHPKRASNAQAVELGRPVAEQELVWRRRVGQPPVEDHRPKLGRVVAISRDHQFDIAVRHRAAAVGAPPEREVDRACGVRDLREALDTVEVHIEPEVLAPRDPSIHRPGRDPEALDRAIGSPRTRGDGHHHACHDTGEGR